MDDKDRGKAAGNADPNDIAALILAEAASGKKAAEAHAAEALRKEAEARQREKDADAKVDEDYRRAWAVIQKVKIKRMAVIGFFLLVLGGALGIGAAAIPRSVNDAKEAVNIITVTNATVTGDTLNFRSSPSGGGALIGTLHKGDVLTVTGDGEEQNGFLPVEYNGEAGFVSGEYVALERSRIASPLKNGTYTFTPRIPGTYGAGSGGGLYLEKIRIDRGDMTLYVTNRLEGKGTKSVEYDDSTTEDFTLGPAAAIFLRDLDHPNRVWKAAYEPLWYEGSFLVGFPNVASGRLELMETGGKLHIPEIILPERAYKKTP
jgi:hypothetical protein